VAERPHPLLSAFDHACDRLAARLASLDDVEYFWEPAPGCWSLRPDGAGHWLLDGGGGGGPAPDPVPVTTIAWRVGHVAGLALGGFADRLFGDGSLDAEGIDFPPRAAGAVPFLRANYGVWRAGLETLDDDRWAAPLGQAWGPYAEDSVEDLALHVFDELVHHGAEIGLLRDLYAAGAGPGSTLRP
jgi:hypothetical protein